MNEQNIKYQKIILSEVSKSKYKALQLQKLFWSLANTIKYNIKHFQYLIFQSQHQGV